MVQIRISLGTMVPPQQTHVKHSLLKGYMDQNGLVFVIIHSDPFSTTCTTRSASYRQFELTHVHLLYRHSLSSVRCAGRGFEASKFHALLARFLLCLGGFGLSDLGLRKGVLPVSNSVAVVSSSLMSQSSAASKPQAQGLGMFSLLPTVLNRDSHKGVLEAQLRTVCVRTSQPRTLTFRRS